MLKAASVAVLGAAAACHAFHVPAVNPARGWISTTSARQQHHSSACCNRSSRQCHRTSPSSLTMTAADGADKQVAAVADTKGTDGKGGEDGKGAEGTRVEGTLGKGEKKWLKDQVFC